jgi:tRNA-specific 2-thiouridylase
MSDSDRKIIVGMSGGVDSSVAALLLKQQGYEVIGVMLKLWAEEGFGRENQCCSLESAQQARKIAAKIGIPFYILDASQPFYQKVVQPFIDSYMEGLTPNPCALCNPIVRWKMLLDYADAVDAKWVATGHYARTETDPEGVVHLFRGVDSQKDQSYVISRLSQFQLQRTIFPLRSFEKKDVRKIASENELPSASKPDSQDICFIGDGDYRKFLLRHRADEIQPGNIVDRDGKIVGRHSGLPFYTIGQRKGLKIAAPDPNYVISKNPQKNEIYVGSKTEFSANIIRINEVNWISGQKHMGNIDAFAQFRYKSTAQPVQAEVLPDNSILIHLADMRNDIACGQFAVLYSETGEVIVSGRIISTGIEK